MALSETELRVLGSLLEKERTTPESYPLTTNALLNACNQKTNRDPVMELTEEEVKEALQTLRDKGLANTTRADNERVFKHRHRLEEALNLSDKGFAVLAVLLLRGHQTPGELRSRTERYVHFADAYEVEGALQQLAEHTPPLAKNYGRGAGQSQDRWSHTLGTDEKKQHPRVRTAPSSSGSRAEIQTDIEVLRAEIEALRESVRRLYDHVGLEE